MKKLFLLCFLVHIIQPSFGARVTKVANTDPTIPNSAVTVSYLETALTSGNFGGFSVVERDGSYVNYETFAAANTAAGSGDTLYFPSGYINTGIWSVKSGVIYQGRGVGEWDGTNHLAGSGTVLVGTVNSPTQNNYGFKNLGFNCGTELNTAMVGGHGVDANAFMYDCLVTGTLTNDHNIEFRGNFWDVKNVKSFGAGNHPFPVKTQNSNFENIYVSGGSGAQPKLYVKADTSGVDVINNTFVNITTVGGGIVLEPYSSRTISNTVIKNCTVDKGGSGIGIEIKSLGTGKSLDTKIIGCHIKNGSHGVGGMGVYGGATDQVNGIYINGCTFENFTVGGVYNAYDLVLKTVNMEVRDSRFINCLKSLAGTTGEGFLTQFDPYSAKQLTSKELIGTSVIDYSQVTYENAPSLTGYQYYTLTWAANANATAYSDYLIHILPNTDKLNIYTTFYGKTTADSTEFEWIVGGLNSINPPSGTYNAGTLYDVDFSGLSANGGGYASITVTNTWDLSNLSLLTKNGVPLFFQLRNTTTRTDTEKVYVLSIIAEQTD